MRSTATTAAALGAALVVAAGFGGPTARADDGKAAPKGFVTRSEYQALERRLRAIEQRNGGGNDQALAEIDQRVSDVEAKADAASSGWTHFLLAGYAAAGYTDREGEPSSFSAAFEPLFLWKIGERILAESEIEFELEEDEIHVGLETAQLSYVVNDWLVLAAGKFLNPASQFRERLHPAWINKLPDKPFISQLVAHTHMGAQARGAVGIPGGAKVSYAFFVSNGPTLISDTKDDVGTLDDTNFDDTNYSKEVGGRIALHPIPAMEIGYGLEWSRSALTDASQREADVWIQTADVNYSRESDMIYGQIDLRAQWIWSHVERVTYDVAGANSFGPISFDNRRQAGYVQFSYRPSKLEGFVSGFEAVVRFDMIDRPRDAPVNYDEKRWAIGLNYWWWDSGVLKVAFERSDRNRGERDEDAVLVQVALGF